MRLLNVKPLHRDIPEGGGNLPEPARRRLLLQGANGSGKSTILETIFTLWKFWGEWVDEGHSAAPPQEQFNHYLMNADLAAVELADIPDMPRLWLGIANKLAEWEALRTTYPGVAAAGLCQFGAPGTVARPTSSSQQEHWQRWWQIQLLHADLLARRQRSLAASELFPNIIYFPPEGRTIRPPDKLRGEIIDTTVFNWTAVYDPAVSLDSIILTVQALSPDRFAECLRLVNLALEHQHKRITGFSPKGRLLVEGKTEAGIAYQHPIEELSSGERQMLLLVAFAVAFLRPGGILLIDEPDLHIHMAMVTQLFQTLEHVVRERNGQLIVASHSELVWDFFSREEERIELSPWRGAQT
jgi:ABC-type lipoprotein export system ATPase subunit